MKKVILSAIIVLMTMGVTFAESDEDQPAAQEPEVYSAQSDEDQPATEEPASISQQPPIAMTEEVLAKKKAELNGTKWNIELKSMVTVKGKSKLETEKDVVNFSEGKIVSEKLAALGYAPTGFNSRMEEDGTLIWETMQTSEEDGTAFWRGDVGPDGIMRGVLSKRDPKENVKDYNFVGTVQSK